MQSLAQTSNPDRLDFDCARSMLEGLPSVVWFMRREMRRHRTRGLSVPQFRVLVQLDRFERLTLSLVAENLGCSLPTASRMVGNMVTRGLVRRSASSEDRRQMLLMITPRGRELFLAARRGTEAILASKIAHLGLAQKREITRVMAVLRSTFDFDALQAHAPERKVGGLVSRAPRSSRLEPRKS